MKNEDLTLSRPTPDTPPLKKVKKNLTSDFIKRGILPVK